MQTIFWGVLTNDPYSQIRSQKWSLIANQVIIVVLQGDKLYGRGTTDCLGHVALITELFIQLAEKKPQLKRSVWAVFIAWYVKYATLTWNQIMW